MSKDNGSRIPVVAVGASAGGLVALKSLLAEVPEESRLAFLIVQHLAPGHPSHMAEILSKVTSLRVELAKDGVEVRPNHAYLNPPGAYLALRGQVLDVRAPGSIGKARMAIDHLFQSAA